ncbi:hypothetical protein L596_018397 [Steinernema carpocapsae]|uniref:ZP domain-containing protein n=1 Tax=Steinernema carpocapsae TaxID=34508 RepID=A0A4U5N4H7_STECR|nr:hypothetical protein L596_018397 [Steinernema carpocapsae]
MRVALFHFLVISAVADNLIVPHETVGSSSYAIGFRKTATGVAEIAFGFSDSKCKSTGSPETQKRIHFCYEREDTLKDFQCGEKMFDVAIVEKKSKKAEEVGFEAYFATFSASSNETLSFAFQLCNVKGCLKANETDPKTNKPVDITRGKPHFTEHVDFDHSKFRALRIWIYQSSPECLVNLSFSNIDAFNATDKIAKLAITYAPAVAETTAPTTKESGGLFSLPAWAIVLIFLAIVIVLALGIGLGVFFVIRAKRKRKNANNSPVSPASPSLASPATGTTPASSTGVISKIKNKLKGKRKGPASGGAMTPNSVDTQDTKDSDTKTKTIEGRSMSVPKTK